MTPAEWVAEAGRCVIADIGQLSAADRAALDGAVKAGTLSRWRGRWYPVTGARYGLGPPKTCYGTAAARAAVS